MGEDRERNNRIYGRGFFDGLQAARTDSEMNQDKYDRIVDGLTGIQRKVLEALSEKEPWRTSQVCNAMYRLTGSKPDISIVQGCLATLVSKGVALEPEKAMYRRIAVRAHVAPAPPGSVGSVDLSLYGSAHPVVAEVIPATDFDAMREDIKEFHGHLTACCVIADRLEARVKATEETPADLQRLRELLKKLG